MPLGCQTERQAALLGRARRLGQVTSCGRVSITTGSMTGSSVICRRIVRWGASACKSCPQPLQALGCASITRAGPIGQWALGLGMPGFRPAVPPAFGLGPIRVLVARGGC